MDDRSGANDLEHVGKAAERVVDNIIKFPEPEMGIMEAVEVLKRHNYWRRYDGPIGECPIPMEEPKVLGKAIDLIIEYFEEDHAHNGR